MRVKKAKWIMAMAAAALLSAGAGSTGATVIHQMTLENAIRTSPFSGSIDEDPDGLKDHIKKTQFTNNSDIDVLIRVAYAETWTAADGSRLPLTVAAADGTAAQAAQPRWDIGNDGLWADGGDGWLYYRKVLRAHTSTPIFVYDVTFMEPSEFKNASDAELYRTGSYDLHFTMEMVQAGNDATVAGDAVEALFGKRLRGVIPDPDPATGTWDKDALLNWPGSTIWTAPAVVDAEQAEAGR